MAESPILISTWHADPDTATELERRAADALAAADGLPGHLGGTVLRDPGSPDVHIVHRFTGEEELQRWLATQERAAQIERLEGVAERRGAPERLTGLEGWFGAQAAPPRWKQWLASFLGAYPLVVLFQWLLAPHVERLPLLLRSAVLPLILLSLMTYVAMPVVTRVLQGWLTRPPAGR